MADQKDVKKTDSSIEADRQNGTSSYDAFILALTLIALVTLVIFYAPGIPRDAKQIALFVDTLISIVFMFDFFRTLIGAPDKLGYLKWGWIDFLGSLPVWPFFRTFRLWRLIRIVRVLRRTRIRDLWRTFTERRAESTLLIVVLAGILILGFASATIVVYEKPAPGGNITSAQDAIWWSLVSVTTVGYGDRFPVTEQGRTVAVVLMILGIGIFSVFTSYLSSGFIAPGDGKQDDELAQMRARLDAIEQLLQELDQKISERP